MDFNAINTRNAMQMYRDYLTDSAASKRADHLAQAADKNYANATDDELMSVCKEFEAYFLEQVFKQMQKTVPESEFSSSSTASLVDYFKDSAIRELAAQSTEQNSLGLAQMMYEQMKRNYGL